MTYRLAARLRRAPVGREEQVLRVPAHDVTDGEAHPTRHHAHVPRPPVLQGEGRAWAGEPLQRHEGGCTVKIILQYMKRDINDVMHSHVLRVTNVA